MMTTDIRLATQQLRRWNIAADIVYRLSLFAPLVTGLLLPVITGHRGWKYVPVVIGVWALLTVVCLLIRLRARKLAKAHPLYFLYLVKEEFGS